MIILTSAAFVQGDLRSEFGPLPPVFLPIGNKSLLHWQLSLLNREFPGETVVLSLPEKYTLTGMQSKLIEQSSVVVVRVPDRFSLASSVLFVLNVTDNREESVRILHGDTLMDSLPRELDIIGVARSTDSYDWQLAESQNNLESRNEVWCGYFSFSNRAALVRSLALHENNFAAALFNYSESNRLADIPADGWLDLGHLNTYFHAREKFTTQRSFNNLQIGDGVVRKSGVQKDKLASEARWFLGLPSEFKKFTPALYDFEEETGAYCLEYLPNLPLNELFVHGAHPIVYWRELIKLVGGWVGLATEFPSKDTVDLERKKRELVEIKTMSRLTAFQHAFGFSLDKPIKVNGRALPSVRTIVEELIREALEKPIRPGLLHGDLCFSNTLYDSRNRRIRVIDPRGVSRLGEGGLVGDVTYDIAKFTHSAIGFYDIIMSGGFELKRNLETMEFELTIKSSARHERIRELVLNEGLLNAGMDDLSDSYAQMILLFLSMAPLHADDVARQWALFVNGLSLYAELVERN